MTKMQEILKEKKDKEEAECTFKPALVARQRVSKAARGMDKQTTDWL